MTSHQDLKGGCERLQQYVNDVLTHPEKYPQTIAQACQRFVNDMARDDIYFDVAAADKAISVIERMPHTKGKWKDKPTILEPWQCFWVGSLFGWKWSSNGLRRFRYAYVQVPRKNGKSHIVICIALLMFGVDDEPGAEVYLGATSQDHCKRLLYKPAKYIANNCKGYKEDLGVEIGATAMVREEANATLTTVIKKPDDGDSPHCAIVDEYHEHETADQFDTFDTGMGSRDQPLLHVITTAGSDLGSPCKSEYDECKRVLRGEIDLDSKFILIYEPDESDEWDSFETVKKVNPNLGVSANEDYLRDQLEIARKSSDKQNIFRTKHLNQWVGAKVAWMNMVAWQRQKSESLRIEDFAGMPCHIGVDLASKKDLAAVCVLFCVDGQYYGFPYFFAPEAAAETNDRYPQFVNRKEITLTDGNMTDYAFIEDKLLQLCGKYDVQSIAYDPYQATYLVTRLQEKRLNLVEYGHTVNNMSEPMKEFEARVLDGSYHHAGNACMSWQMGNVTARIDVKENIYPNKANKNDERCKIDGVVAMIMAFGRWMAEPEISPYEERGFRTL